MTKTVMTDNNIHDLAEERARREDRSLLDFLLDDVLSTMGHARVFIASREKMHPEGIRQYDEFMESLAHLRSGGPYR
jgi:hypothetical protein